MFCDLLTSENTEFVRSVDRSFPRFRSSSLKAVVDALGQCQGMLSKQNLDKLKEALETWRKTDPKEFNVRGGTNGVAWRLWMEVKQFLQNKYETPALTPDPPMPHGCPGNVILGVYVPACEDHMEICHGFAYRWLVCAGKMKETVSAGKNRTAFNGTQSKPLLYPEGANSYPAARADGKNQFQAGDLIGMFVGDFLCHSLIADTNHSFFSANNAGTFGLGTGRSRIDLDKLTQVNGAWVDSGNQYKTFQGQIINVIYRRKFD
jgi:hypothetical protein